MFGIARLGCGISPDLSHLVWPESGVLHNPPGAVGPVGGKLPVGISIAARQGPVIGMALKDEFVWQLAELSSYAAEKRLGTWFDLGARCIEE